MDTQAIQASKHLAETGCITVVVQDNGPIHTSSKVRYSLVGVGTAGTLLFLFAQILLRNESD